MFSSFTSLSQRERKRQELLLQAEKELAIERQLDQRYAETMWAADNESGLIDLSKPTTAQTMTTASTPIPANLSRYINVPIPTSNQPTSGFINLNEIPVATEEPAVFSTPDVEMKPGQPDEGGLPDAYYGVRALLREFPSLMSALVNPIFKQGVFNKPRTYFFGREDGRLHKTNDRKPIRDDLQKLLETKIDWDATREYMKERLLSIGEDKERIAAAFDALRRNVVGNRMYDADKAERRSKTTILSILSTNRTALKRVDLVPIGKLDGSVMTESYKLDKRTLELSRDGEDLTDAQANELVSWEKTLIRFLTKANDAKIPLDIPAGFNIQYSVPKRSLGDSAVSQSDVQRPRARSDVDSGEISYESKIKFIFQNNSLMSDYNQLVSPVGPDGFVQDYMFASDGSLVKRGSMEPLTAADRASEAYGQIQWEATYHYFIDSLNKAYRDISNRPADSINGEMKQVLRQINYTLIGLGERKTVEGRGLRGAGYINKELKDKDGNLIKYHLNKGYNLAQLEGTGNASALAYKRVGTKFVHLSKLNEHLLKVVYPNRSAVGTQKKISANLAQLIKTLVFDGTIDQQLYDSLPLADKRVFHELLRITHTQNTLRDPVKDPRDVLKQEYIKLKGELMLGNDNPDMIRELKQVLVDMYSAKLISDDEFKQVLVALL